MPFSMELWASFGEAAKTVVGFFGSAAGLCVEVFYQRHDRGG